MTSRMPAPWPAPVSPGPLDARVQVPGSKSETARALVLAALAQGPTRLLGALDSRDTRLMAEALTLLGAHVEWGDPARDLLVTPSVEVRTGATVDCGLAGTVARFVPALAALGRGTTTFTGDETARTRPMGPLLTALSSLGARVKALGEPGFLPFAVTGPLEAAGPGGRAVTVDASASSQFLSALLLAAPAMGGTVRVTAPPPLVSLPHVRMTVAALRARGIRVEEEGAGTDGAGDARAGLVPAGGRTWVVHEGRPRGGDVVIEPDLSNAGVFLAAACVCGGRVRVAHWPATTTQAGDAWRGLLERMGAEVRREGADLVVEGPAGGHRGPRGIRGLDADLSAVGELTPVLAALCTLARTPSRLTGIAHLRGHETDRLRALATEITRLGGDVDELSDGLVIRPAPLHAARLRTYADHRMVTFAAVIGLAVPGVTVEDVRATSKTLPGFEDLWAGMLAGGAHGDA